MDAEFLQLAREAVTAMQGPSWVEIAQLLVSGVGLGCIVWGLFQMQAAGERRNKEIDVLGKALERQGEAMTQALTQQGEAMTKAFTQQGEVLAELLRRTA